MKILVTVKRVMDYNVKPKVKPDGSGVVTDGVNMIVNPFDEIAIEEALRLKEKHGGEVVVLSVGSKDCSTQIRAALAMGADRGVLVTQDGYLDPDAAARIVKAVFDQEKPDLVIMGKQAIDDDSNQTGQLFAEYANLGQTATVTREVDGGLETVQVELPALVTTDLRLNTPRYASLPGIMKAKKKEVKELTAAQLGVDVTPKVRVLRLEEPKARQAGTKVPDVKTLVERLRLEAKAL
jgi:electron transfer flavoprotein beta subunit